MSYFNTGKRGREEGARTNHMLKSAGYKRGGAVKDDGAAHITIHIGDGGAAGGGGPGMVDSAKQKAFQAGMAAGMQGAMPPPPPPPPPGGAPGMGGPPMPPPGPPPMGGLPPGGPPMPGMKRGGRISKAKPVMGLGIKEPKKTPNLTGKSPMGSGKGGASQAAKRTGPPINNMKSGGAVKKAFGGGMGSNFSGLPSNASPSTATGQVNNLPVDMPAGSKLNLGLPASGGSGSKRGGVVKKAVGGPMGTGVRPQGMPAWAHGQGRGMPAWAGQQGVTPQLPPQAAAQAIAALAARRPAPVAPVAPAINPMINKVAPVGTGGMGVGTVMKRGGSVKGQGVVGGHRTSGVVQPGYQSGGGGGGAGRLTKIRIEKKT